MQYTAMVEIDPGTAFGTGSHETTKLCIKLLRKYISGIKNKELKQGKGKNTLLKEREKALEILDVGTGSGILGIIALSLVRLRSVL